MFTSDEYKTKILLHKPHPRKELLEYQVKQLIEQLEQEGLLWGNKGTVLLRLSPCVISKHGNDTGGQMQKNRPLVPLVKHLFQILLQFQSHALSLKINLSIDALHAKV